MRPFFKKNNKTQLSSQLHRFKDSISKWNLLASISVQQSGRYLVALLEFVSAGSIHLDIARVFFSLPNWRHEAGNERDRRAKGWWLRFERYSPEVWTKRTPVGRAGRRRKHWPKHSHLPMISTSLSTEWSSPRRSASAETLVPTLYIDCQKMVVRVDATRPSVPLVVELTCAFPIFLPSISIDETLATEQRRPWF